MSLGHGPSIVTNGLLLALDATNTKSYPGSGTTWTDVSGQGQNFTLKNSTAFVQDNTPGFKLTSANSSYINGLKPTGFDFTGSFTFDVWFRYDAPSTIGNGAHIIGVSNRADGLIRSGSGFNCHISIDGSNKLRIFTFSGGGAYTDYDTGFTVNVGEICHVGFMQNGSTNKAGYKNGVVSAYSPYWSTQNFSYILIGGDHNESGYFTQLSSPNITIYGVKLYNRSLSATEVAQNFNALRGRYGI